MTTAAIPASLLPLEKLRQRIDLNQTSERQWEAKCPAHDDNRESLCVGQLTGDGTLGIKCQAGCDTKDVLAALGLSMADLFPAKSPPAANARDQKGEIERTCDYRDADGNLVFQAVRMKPKNFKQRRPKPGQGKWIWSVTGCSVIPYRLAELLAADSKLPVFVVEGEKDVDRLVALGLVATCNAGGGGKCKPGHAEFLCGRSVVILPDNDGTGLKHPSQVAASLYGRAEIKILELPDLPKKGDVSDWLDAGGTLEALTALVAAAPLWEPRRATLQFCPRWPCQASKKRSVASANHSVDCWP